MADTRKMVAEARKAGRDVPLSIAELIHHLEDRIAALEAALQPKPDPRPSEKKAG